MGFSPEGCGAEGTAGHDSMKNNIHKYRQIIIFVKRFDAV
jgi:hypothetical protein